MIRLHEAAALLAVLTLAACGDAGDNSGEPVAPYDEACSADGSEVGYPLGDEPCARLTSYGFFEGEPAEQVPASTVVPYTITTPLFSDYSAKDRFVWMPEGTSADYVTDSTFTFPVGTVLIKTFAFPHDMRDPAAGRRIIETRLLVHEEEGWSGHPYVWNDDQTEAYYRRTGETVDVSWMHHDGTEKNIRHVVPNINNCKECHATHSRDLDPIGPAARYLDMPFDYEDGTENQLARWKDVGYLSGLSAGHHRAIVWDEEESGDLEERARTYLDINCAHCHNGTGQGRTSGLRLDYAETPVAEMTSGERSKLGICKSSIAAGQGSGGRDYVIVPGESDASILQYRIEATALSEMMPELGRTLVHAEGVELVREWIDSMDPALGSCSSP